MLTTAPVPAATTYGLIYRNNSRSSTRVVTAEALDVAQVTRFGAEECVPDAQALQPHWGSKLIGDALNSGTTVLSQEDLLTAASRARQAFQASTERLGSLSSPSLDNLNELRGKLPSSIPVPSMPSLPSMPPLPSVDFQLPEKTSIVSRASDTYHSAFDSTQNVIADRVERLSTDLSAIADHLNSDIASNDITPETIQRAAVNVIDDLHAIKGALDDHNLVFVPTLSDAMDKLQNSTLEPHFGTDLIVAVSKASAADIVVLLSELGRFLGIGKAIEFVLDVLVLGPI